MKTNELNTRRDEIAHRELQPKSRESSGLMNMAIKTKAIGTPKLPAG